MNRLDIPGAILTVVRGDRLLLNRGYGVADREKGVPMSAESTVVRTASVSKIFTAIAALQLAESGLLSLDEDLRSGFPELELGTVPLTLRHLLTHTAGFDERSIGYLSSDTVTPVHLDRVIRVTLPRRTRIAEGLPAYSNHGYALAGLVVERAAALPFHQYADTKIFAPLGMRSTHFMVPPMPSTRTRMAAEYRSTGERRELTYSPTYPAGNVGTTGADMARLLTALLRPDSVVITAETRRRLAGSELAYHPEMPGMGLGLSGQRLGGQLVWIKGGASRSHSAVIALFPELDLGVFVAVNRQEPTAWRLMLGRFADSTTTRSGVRAIAPRSPAKTESVDGAYRWTRVPLSSAEKVIGLAAQIQLRARRDTLEVEGPEINGTYVRIGTTLYRDAQGRELAVRSASGERTSHVFSIVDGQPVTFERIRVHQTARFQGWLALAGVSFTLASGAIAWRRRSELEPWERAVLIGLPLAEVATIVSIVPLLQSGDALALGATPAMRIALTLTTVTAATAAAQIVAGGTSTAKSRGIALKAGYGLGTVGGATILGLLATNNLIGWRF